MFMSILTNFSSLFNYCFFELYQANTSSQSPAMRVKNPSQNTVEQVFCNDVDKCIEAILWEHEKYWQSQLFTNVYGMNSVSDLYSRKRKGCRSK